VTAITFSPRTHRFGVFEIEFTIPPGTGFQKDRLADGYWQRLAVGPVQFDVKANSFVIRVKGRHVAVDRLALGVLADDLAPTTAELDAASRSSDTFMTMHAGRSSPTNSGFFLKSRTHT
jgi:hypothetical protein